LVTIRAAGTSFAPRRAELSRRSVVLDELRAMAQEAPLTLLYAARDELHNEAIVLMDLLAD
jgi:uncharacterized protein YeaO (DUF488 family)